MFLITFKQVAILLGYIMLGFFLCKGKIIGKEGSKVLSKLLVFVFAPVYTLSNLMSSVSVDKISQYAVTIGAGVIVTVLAIGIGIVVAKVFTKDKFERSVYGYVFAFSNIGYFGAPLVGAVFGKVMLAEFLLFTLPLNVGISTYGYFILTRPPEGENQEKSSRKDFLKRIFSPSAIATILGLVLGLLPFEMPGEVYEALSPAANCMSATAMILAGIVLSTCSVKEMFCSVKSYFAALVRLIIIPVIFGGISFILYKFAGLSENLFVCITAFSCLPAGMNAIVYPEAVGNSGKLGAKVCFIQYVLALASVPLCFLLLSTLV